MWRRRVFLAKQEEDYSPFAEKLVGCSNWKRAEVGCLENIINEYFGSHLKFI